VLRSVALCEEHGLIDGTQLSVDGFDVEADAALASLRASLAAVEDSGASAESPIGEGGGEAGTSQRPQLAFAGAAVGPAARAPVL
jgi:hypothetical protein